jgi:RimJ/RimL family protein N-acetyltransferase
MMAGMDSVAASVALVPLVQSHAAATARWMQDPFVRGNVGVQREITLESTQQWIRAAAEDPAVLPFAIMAGGRHVGNVTIDRIDAALRSGRFSIYVGEPEYRGRGVGTEATRLVLREAFARAGLNKLWLIVHDRNPGALRAYLAAGFAIEGVHRDEFLLDGRLVSVFYMGVLRADVPNLCVE